VHETYQAHAKEFPVIAKMAQDFLTVMGTSVSAKRLFFKLATDLPGHTVITES
jgi:hypothetical protein